MIKFHCSHCKKKLGVPDNYAGHRVRCAACNQHTIVPRQSEEAPAAVQPPRVAATDQLVASKRSDDGREVDGRLHTGTAPSYSNENKPSVISPDNDLLSAEDIFSRPKSAEQKKTGDSYHFPQSNACPELAERIENRTSKINQGVAATDPDSSGEADGVVNANADSPDDELKLAPQDDLPPPDPHLEAIRQASLQRARERSETDDTPDTKEKIKPFKSNEPVAHPEGYWPFVFPLRGPGLAILAVFMVCEIFISLLRFLPMLSIVGLMIFFIALVIRGYIFWYLYLCVQAAAEGRIRSPDILGEDEGDFMDLIARLIRMCLAVLLCMAPLIIYSLWLAYARANAQDTRYIQSGVLLWGLFAGGLFFLPMTLLAVVMHDSASGFNPLLIILSVAKTFFKYLVLVVCFSIPMAGVVLTSIFSNRLGIWFTVPAGILSLYFCIVGAAMLGRFFYNNEKTLDWF